MVLDHALRELLDIGAKRLRGCQVAVADFGQSILGSLENELFVRDLWQRVVLGFVSFIRKRERSRQHQTGSNQPKYDSFHDRFLLCSNRSILVCG